MPLGHVEVHLAMPDIPLSSRILNSHCSSYFKAFAASFDVDWAELMCPSSDFAVANMDDLSLAEVHRLYLASLTVVAVTHYII